MTDHQDPSDRRPLGERDNDERQLPFGARKQSRRPSDIVEHPLYDRPQPAPSHHPAPPPAPTPEEPDEVVADPFDIESFLAETSIEDEPPSAPLFIRARKRRGRIEADESFLKPVASVEPEPEYEPEPEFEPEPEPELEPEPQAAAPAAAPATINFWVMLRTIGAIFLAAGGIATVFTWWTPNSFMPVESVDQLSVALATQEMAALLPTAIPTTPPQPTAAPVALNNIGIVAGHMGLNPSSGLPDPGSICADGLTEESVNEAVARLVVDWMRQSGYTVDLFDEFDPRLQGYSALAMLSIHADSCEYINDLATGFKVASFAETTTPQEDQRLVGCLVNRYAETTGMSFHPSVTFDMTQYHNFAELAPGTPGAIIETGFMYLDREMLTQHQDVIALGIARGLLCYLRNEPIDGTAATPLPAEVTPSPVP